MPPAVDVPPAAVVVPPPAEVDLPLAAVDPRLPPAEVDPPPAAKAWRKGGWTYVPYAPYGHIVFKDGHCNAHCGCPVHSAVKPYMCHMDRQTSKVHPQTGRVLGLLALWLEKSTCCDRAWHASVQYKKILGQAACHDDRKAARERLKLLPDWHALKAAERRRVDGVDGNDSEPEIVK